MNIVIFDTETTSLDKPFCYNIGYVIYNTELMEVMLKRSYVIEQVWHNPMLFTTAYYSDKREIYVSQMRGRKTLMRKFGTVCQQMIHDFAKYEVCGAYAYNSGFDERVFNFNCDWFRCNNPFDETPIFDIRGYAIEYIVNDIYKEFCDENDRYTESGNYSTTAETVFAYISNNANFIEDHTALEDSEIECEILAECLVRGAEINKEYPTPRSVKKEMKKILKVRQDKETVYEIECNSYTLSKSRNTIYIR